MGLLHITLAVLAMGGGVPPALEQDAPGALEGRIVREIRVGPVRRAGTADLVRSHLSTRVGAPLVEAMLVEDRRRLDALRLFSAIALEPTAEGDGVVVHVRVTEILRFLPFIALTVTDENGASAGPGFKGVNVLGAGAQSAGTAKFGGATSWSMGVERPTITPGRWSLVAQADSLSRRNEIFDFDEDSTSIVMMAGWNRTVRWQAGGRVDLTWMDTGGAPVALSTDGSDWLPSVGGFVVYNALNSTTNPTEGWFGQLDVQRQSGDASTWILTLDGRRVQPLTSRGMLSIALLATRQSGELGTDVPTYNQFGLGGENSVRGWSLGSRIGQNQAIGTLEYLHVVVPVRPFTVFGMNLYGGIQLAGFADVGMAWTGQASASEAIDGYGVGLRVLFPFVDVLRLDLAFGEPGGGAVFAVGVSLKADKQRDRVR